MKNVLKTLIYDRQVSLTLLDATETVNEAARLHGLSPTATVVLGKTLAVMTFMSACLKEKRGEISVSFKGNGEGGNVSVSGDGELFLRGFIERPSAGGETYLEDKASLRAAERACLGESGTITLIREDGYSVPFVGACELPEGGVDEAFEEYFSSSEQLLTRICSEVLPKKEGGCSFAGAVVLQPLPFADAETLKKLPSREKMEEIVRSIASAGLQETADRFFSTKGVGIELREAEYKCRCSREYIGDMLVSLGKAQLEEMIQTDGEIRVHCHYCNKDYVFVAEDVEKLFP